MFLRSLIGQSFSGFDSVDAFNAYFHHEQLLALGIVLAATVLVRRSSDERRNLASNKDGLETPGYKRQMRSIQAPRQLKSENLTSLQLHLAGVKVELQYVTDNTR